MLALALALLAVCRADFYLHNMRGSNNRLNEANRDRDNANRLFDSQNNNRGGYNVGRMYFYEGEIIPHEWFASPNQFPVFSIHMQDKSARMW